MKPYYEDGQATLYQADSLNGMMELEPESVQCVVTSPPYWGLRKYSGEQDMVWGNGQCEHEWAGEYRPATKVGNQGMTETGKWPAIVPDSKPNSSQFCSLCGAWRGAYGLEPSPEMYVEHTIEFLRAIRRVLRKDGVVFWNIGDSYAMTSFRGGDTAISKGNVGRKEWTNFDNRSTAVSGLKPKDLCLIPFRVALAAQADGWWVRSVIIWSKPNPMPESVKDRPTESHEYVLMLTKSARYYFDQEAVRERSTANSAGAAKGASLGSSTLAPEFGSTLLADDTTPNLRGRCYLSESQITINGSVTGDTGNLKVIKLISLTIIGEQAERQFMMDLQPSSDTTSLALITRSLKSLSASNAPVRATIVNTPTPPSGAIGSDPMDAEPFPTTSPTTEAMPQAVSMLARIAEKRLPALVTLYSEELESPLLIRATLSASHIDHNTINTNISQGRNLRSVWTFPTFGFPEAHFAVFPEKLPEKCILAASKEGDIILDPFAGAGTTLRVAKRLGRRAIGFDTSKEYCNLAIEGCRQLNMSEASPGEEKCHSN